VTGAAPTPWTLRGRLGRLFAVTAGVLALVAAAVTISTVFFVKAGNDVIYTWQPALVRTDLLLSDLLDQETGIRGYALSHDRAFLAPYTAAVQAQGTDDRRIVQLIGGDAKLSRLLALENQAITAWQTDFARPGIAAVTRGDTASVSRVQSADAKKSFDLIRTRAASLRSELVARTLDARATRNHWGVVFVVALGIGLVLIIALALLLWRGLHRWVLGPVDRLGAQTRIVSSGDTHRPITPEGPLELTDLGQDVEHMRQQIADELARAERITDELRVRSEELARSNEDLQQFAYVASHDLSEPLRKVANFCQLLERQYSPQLDDRARQYIDFAVDGAKRMQVLITDLLALSRVGRTTEEFKPIDLGKALDQATATLSDRIVVAGGRVERLSPMPTVPGDRALLTSLLENLVGNAVKYRRDDVAPVVTVAAELDEVARRWTFTVADNGIGIDPQFAERIFAVFQRLHLRDQYGGTGIGLALCRRIVEFHGGQIWLEHVESAQAGATFRFTLPA
jgi:signal transduction histidine kinase